jgi:ABC-type nitrate/sulfonate/bicarbonate transport system substrate-binding protein
MKKNHLSTMGVLFLAMALIISACGNAGSAPASAPTDMVTVQLSWFHGVEYAGFYAAAEKGYYADENLEVTLVAGGPETNPLDEVAAGNAQFGIGQGDSLIIAHTEGQNFVAVGTIFRDNPLAITSLTSSNILRPADLAGKTVGVYSLDLSSYGDLLFLAFMSRTGLEKDAMTYALIEDFYGANEIKAGRMEAMSGMFATDQQVMTKDAGDDINIMYYKDYGVDVYINTIFVTEEFMQGNPDLIARFMRATMKGYQYALEHTDEVAALALNYDSELDLGYQEQVMKLQVPFIDTGNAPVGSMDENVWTITQDILLEFGMITSPVDLSKVYTNRFIVP